MSPMAIGEGPWAPVGFPSFRSFSFFRIQEFGSEIQQRSLEQGLKSPAMNFQDFVEASHDVSTDMACSSSGQLDTNVSKADRPSDLHSGRDADSNSSSDHDRGANQKELLQACVFVQSQLGCLRGDRCPYPHQGPLLSRRKGLRKGQRERIEQRVMKTFKGHNLSEVQEAWIGWFNNFYFWFDFVWWTLVWSFLDIFGP